MRTKINITICILLVSLFFIVSNWESIDDAVSTRLCNYPRVVEVDGHYEIAKMYMECNGLAPRDVLLSIDGIKYPTKDSATAVRKKYMAKIKGLDK